MVGGSENLPAIGIDFGTTKTCVAVYRDGALEVIADEEGYRLTPAYVAFTERGRLIGREAKVQAALHPENTIYDVQRLLGRSFTDVVVESDAKRWPFKLVNQGGRPLVEVQTNGHTKTFFPEEICGMILARMKEIAENFLGREVTKAVISIPATCTFRQRQAFTDAAKIAGLQVLHLVTAPLLAASAYEFERKVAEKRAHNVFVFDLGGGSLDVAVVTIDRNSLEVKSLTGDNYLGGDDFDSLMVRHFVDVLAKTKKIDISENNRALRQLKTACERAKRQLSAGNQASVEVDSVDFCSTVSRESFEKIIEHLLSASLTLVLQKTLREARKKVFEIDDVLLVGGSSRIPRMQMLLSEFFDGKKLTKSVNADEAIAMGAAIQAAVLTGNCSEEIREFSLMDAMPTTLAIETSANDFRGVIQRNTSIPSIQTETLSTFLHNQLNFLANIYEGERTVGELLGSLEITELPMAPAGVLQIEVTFNIDADLNISVSAVERHSNRRAETTISSGGFLAEENIDRMRKDVERYQAEDLAIRKRQHAKNALEEYIFSMKKTIAHENLVSKIDPSDFSQVEAKCGEVQAWLEANEQAKLHELTDQQKKLEHICDPVVRKACQKLLNIC